jgi:hypothetical protein
MSRRRPVRALGLLLCVAVAFSGFVANADAKSMSKAKKQAISKKLLRAVKHNPKVISKRWFLKQASLVSFSLPSTIRLSPAKDQNGNIITNDTTKNTAVLNLGPSLGSRTIGLTGALHANINFNDAFDGGSLGDVKISLPSDTSALTTTGVPLLTNSNARATAATIAPEAELINLIIPNAAAGATIAITNGHTGTTITAPFAVTSALTGGAPTAMDTALLASAQAALSVGGNYASAVGANGVYEYSAPFAALPPSPLVAACPPGAPGVYQCTVVSFVFTGKDAGGNSQNGVPWLPEFPSGSPLPAAAFPDWRKAAVANGDPVTNTAPILNAPTVVPVGPNNLEPIGASIRATKGTKDTDGMGGCGSFEGNGTGSTGVPSGFNASGTSARDTDFVSNLVGTSLDNSGNDVNQMGPGPFDGLGIGSTAVPGDVVLRTPPLKLSIASPGTVDAPGDNSDNPGGELAANYTSPATTLTVDDASAFHDGNAITVSDGFNQSLGTIAANGVNTTLNTITLTGGLLPAHNYTANNATVQVNSTGVVKKVIGASGGRANLFGNPVNGLAKGNSVDVTVNLGLDLTAISRQVDGAFPEPAGPGNVNEKTGNISAYFNCRQAWTGNIRNYLNGIKLVGALRISPAVTADGKVRIAKVALRTPAPVPAQLAACLQPYQLYMSGNPLLADPAGKTVGPQLLPAGTFNPLAVLFGSGVPDANNGAHNFLSNSAAPTATPCNTTTGPLDRDPFNVSSKAGGTGLSNLLSSGAAVGVSGDISTKIQAEVIIGNYPG